MPQALPLLWFILVAAVFRACCFALIDTMNFLTTGVIHRGVSQSTMALRLTLWPTRASTSIQ